MSFFFTQKSVKCGHISLGLLVIQNLHQQRKVLKYIDH